MDMHEKMIPCKGNQSKQAIGVHSYWIHRKQFKVIEKKTRIWKLRCLVSVVLSVFCIALGGSLHVNTTSCAKLQEGIAKEIIRFHCIANSDRVEDQQIKLRVKNKIVSYLSTQMTNVTNINEARDCIRLNEKKLEEIANEVLITNGFSYTATISLEQKEFPLKVYGDIVLMPGSYEALCIRLGEAKGQNWWCIVFPTLCFVDSTYSVVPADKKEQLQFVLTQEEYDAITSEKPRKVKIKCRFYDWLKEWFQNQ